jgi:hypothetical protein
VYQGSIKGDKAIVKYGRAYKMLADAFDRQYEWLAKNIEKSNLPGAMETAEWIRLQKLQPDGCVRCRICGAPMTLRKNRQTQEPFWGCSEWPKCAGVGDKDTETSTDARALLGDAEQCFRAGWNAYRATLNVCKKVMAEGLTEL